jgi:PAS domain S-box-containing protein
VYSLALAALAAALLLRWLLDPLLGDHLPLVTLFGAVAAAVWLGGSRPALLVMVLGYVVCDYFFIEPRLGFGYLSVRNAVGLIAYLVTCGIIMAFGEAMRLAWRRADERRELLRVTFASIGDAVITTDTGGRTTSLNAVAESLTGWTRSEAVGQPLETVFRIVNEESRKPAENPTRRALREGLIVGLANHTILITRDGTQLPIDDSAAPIKDEQGRILGCVLIFRDITARRRAEKEVRESEARFRLTADSAPVLIWMSRPDKLCDWFNQPWLDFVGRPIEKELGNGWAENVHPADLARCLEIYTTSFDARQPFKMEYRLRRADGEYRWILDHGVPRISGQGEFMGYIGSCIDIHDRKRDEETRARLAAIVETSNDAVISKNLEGKILTWNESAERIFGYSAAEAVGQPITLLIPPDRQEEEGRILASLRRGERVARLETVRVAKDGRRIDVSITVSPIKDAEGRVIAASKILRDITERKRAEAQLLEEKERLREADRRKDEFLAMLAHELRNPLAPIVSAINLLKLKGPPEPILIKARDVIERQAGHLARLVDDLLDVSRITGGKISLRRSKIELRSVVASGVEAARDLLESKRQAFSLSIPEQPIHLHADATRLAQVIGNLLNNAAKYTAEGGTITLSAEERDSRLILRIRDSGIGVPAHMLPRIFDLFTQVDQSLDRSQGGLGIGLTVARRLIEMHDGTIEALSEGPGKGTEFVISLPLYATEPSQAAKEERDWPVPESQESPGQAPCRVLVVDDNIDAVETIASLLRHYGYEVQVAHDGSTVLEAVRSFRPRVMFLDIGLPGLHGYEVASLVRQEFSREEVLLIALSGYGQEEDRKRAREAGFDQHLVKPVEPETLRGVIARVCSSSTS